MKIFIKSKNKKENKTNNNNNENNNKPLDCKEYDILLYIFRDCNNLLLDECSINMCFDIINDIIENSIIDNGKIFKENNQRSEDAIISINNYIVKINNNKVFKHEFIPYFLYEIMNGIYDTITNKKLNAKLFSKCFINNNFNNSIIKFVDQIIEIIHLCNKHKVNHFILGNGSNLLVSDEGYYGVVINIHENNFSNIEVKKEDEKNYLVQVGGGMLMKTFAIELCLLSITGLEDIIDIPGTVGGGIIMNVSFHSNALIKYLLKVKVITPEGILKELNKDECGFIHRGSFLKDKKYYLLNLHLKVC